MATKCGNVLRREFLVNFQKITYEVITDHRNDGRTNGQQDISILFIYTSLLARDEARAKNGFRFFSISWTHF